mgnify:CR=1 FL=1
MPNSRPSRAYHKRLTRLQWAALLTQTAPGRRQSSFHSISALAARRGHAILVEGRPVRELAVQEDIGVELAYKTAARIYAIACDLGIASHAE